MQSPFASASLKSVTFCPFVPPSAEADRLGLAARRVPSGCRSVPRLVRGHRRIRSRCSAAAAVSAHDQAAPRPVAEVLAQIAREWVKADSSLIAKLTMLAGKVPMVASGLSDKNKRFLRQFDDPAALVRLVNLPKVLWPEVKRDATSNFRTLAKAQAALAPAILTYMPLRLQNLSALTFGTHLFLREEPGAISTVEIPTHETKNETELGFDIPPSVARILFEYRNRIAPKVIGHRPERLFVNANGTPKNQKTVARLISSYLHKRTGIVLTPHQFRHLSAKVMLDAEPGSFESVKQLLGHKNLRTTAAFYTGIDSRRAARHHQRLIDETLEAQTRSQHEGRRTSAKNRLTDKK